jgi:hypothetical protein
MRQTSSVRVVILMLDYQSSEGVNLPFESVFFQAAYLKGYYAGGVSQIMVQFVASSQFGEVIQPATASAVFKSPWNVAAQGTLCLRRSVDRTSAEWANFFMLYTQNNITSPFLSTFPGFVPNMNPTFPQYTPYFYGFSAANFSIPMEYVYVYDAVSLIARSVGLMLSRQVDPYVPANFVDQMQTAGITGITGKIDFALDSNDRKTLQSAFEVLAFQSAGATPELLGYTNATTYFIPISNPTFFPGQQSQPTFACSLGAIPSVGKYMNLSTGTLVTVCNPCPLDYFAGEYATTCAPCGPNGCVLGSSTPQNGSSQYWSNLPANTYPIAAGPLTPVSEVDASNIMCTIFSVTVFESSYNSCCKCLILLIPTREPSTSFFRTVRCHAS